MKTLWTLIKSSPIYKIFAGMVIGLLILMTFNLVGNCTPGNEPSEMDVAIQLAIDSVKEQHANELIAHEDSIQKIAYNSLALLQSEKDKEAAKTKKLERKLSDLNKSVAELEKEYAEQCGELITKYRERHDTTMSIIKQKAVELKICNNEVDTYISIARSQDVEITALKGTVKEKNKTIGTQRDRLASITNRSDRNFIFRNWKWATGGWRKFVLE